MGQKSWCVNIAECTEYLCIIRNLYFLICFRKIIPAFFVDHRLVYIFSQAIPFSHVRFDRSSDWIPAMEEVEHIVEDISFRYTKDIRGQRHEFFWFWLFSWISLPPPLRIPLGPLQFFWKFSGEGNSRLGGNWFMKKTRSRKSRDTVL